MTDPAPKLDPNHGDDPELAALLVCVASLLTLTPEARRRVIEYIGQRFGDDE
jgi:hypothetical protein